LIKKTFQKFYLLECTLDLRSTTTHTTSKCEACDSSLTFLDELTAGVLDAGWARFAAAGRIRTIPHTPFVTAAVALKGIGHGDQRVYDFRCSWRDLGRRRRDTKKTRSPGRAGIHVHVQVVHGSFALGSHHLSKLETKKRKERCVNQVRLINADGAPCIIKRNENKFSSHFYFISSIFNKLKQTERN